MRFVREADYAVQLPGDAPSESYLRADAILDAARLTGADAIHPGYGFLSENADFARSVIDSGLVWIGPSPESIEAMGSKIEAKQAMKAAGVPVLEVPSQPTSADLPLLIKASAGGGGRGMRVVRDLGDLPAEMAAGQAEALSAFGDGTVFMEPYVERGRHIEVQVIGTRDGVLALGTRDCSVQRRHQKVIEEAPAHDVSEALVEAARLAAASIGYLNADTVEFLVEGERFFFLEMNTRLQVEHPVTEAIYGLDLVELQLEVAAGGGHSARVQELIQNPPTPHGCAVEARLYAEDPAADYQPHSGVIHRLDIPHDSEFASRRDGIRLDSGFGSGDSVGTHYDAMLAKVISVAPSREQAIAQLRRTLMRSRLHGLVTNRDQLVAILDAPAFGEGPDTSFLAQFEWKSPNLELAPVAATLALAEHRADQRVVHRGIPVGWRNVQAGYRSTRLRCGDEDIEVQWRGGRDGYQIDGEVEVVSASPTQVRLRSAGVTTTYEVSIVGDAVHVDAAQGSAAYVVVPRFTDPAAQISHGSLLAPMPGTVVSVGAAEGDAIEAGTPVLVIEAMKMQHTVSTPSAGVLTKLNVKPGQQVASGEVLAIVEAKEES
ncbi:MAG: biotin carboxylase N-terminal domain-containing protein [Marmoricola sp.]